MTYYLAYMELSKLSLINFKNFDTFDLEPVSKFNCFVGYNGVGKTNLLDSIYYLSFTKSFLQANDKQHIKFGHDFFMINGEFIREDKTEDIACTVKHGQKKIFKRNGKEYDKLSEHIGLLPIVYSAPFDINIVQGGSETRRRFTDTVISQFNKDYLRHLISYQRAIDQRNQLLKSNSHKDNSSESSLEAWDMQLIKHGNEIFSARQSFTEEITPIFNKYYKQISLNRDQVSFKYVSQLHQDSFEKLLINSRERDKYLQYTTTGIHKDETKFLLGEHLLRKIGSQGQQKSYVLALKLAQYEYIAKKTEHSPILLLDDIFDKLDGTRVEAIIELVSKDDFGQIFVTDTNLKRLDKLMNRVKSKSKVINL